MNSSKINTLKTKMLSRSGANPIATSARSFSSVIGGQEGSTVSKNLLILILAGNKPYGRLYRD